MTIFKSTRHILDFPWGIPVRIPTTAKVTPPTQKNWNSQTIPSFEDVEYWEELYFQPGNIGIYAAWSPYVDLYMITYNLFINDSGVVLYSGPTAAKEVWMKANELKIQLPLTRNWVDNLNDEEDLTLPPF
jgi:hypothetical protein